MVDCFTLPEKDSKRVAFNGEPGADKLDLFSFHQGDGAGTKAGNGAPSWDPFDFHQKSVNPGRDAGPPQPPKPGDTTPQPPSPSDTNLPLPPLPDKVGPREIKLPDGALNMLDENGRVVLTRAADGSKTREVRYQDQADPTRVTQVIIDQSRIYTRNADGRSWTCEVNGQPAGTWYGDVHMSTKGEYSLEDDRTGEQRKFAANTAEISNRAQQGDCTVQNNCNTNYRPEADSRYYQPQQQYYPQQRYVQQEQCYPQQQYYSQQRYVPQQQYYPQQQYHPQRYMPQQQCYPQQQSYYNDGGCNTPGYYRNGNVGAQIGASVLNGMLYSTMPHYGYRPYGGYYGGYGGGNIGGAIVGSLIGRAIMGGGHHRRW